MDLRAAGGIGALVTAPMAVRNRPIAMRRILPAVAVVTGVGLITSAFVVGTQGYGPLSSVLCPVDTIAYVAVPYPAPVLTMGTELHVGDKRAVLSDSGKLLPPEQLPRLTGDLSSLRVDTTVAATSRSCERVLHGYQFTVFTAVRPGQAVVTFPNTPDRTLRIRVVP